MHLLLSFADAFENIRGQVVVFDVLKSAVDNLTEVEGFGSPGLRGQESKSLLCLRCDSRIDVAMPCPSKL